MQANTASNMIRESHLEDTKLGTLLQDQTFQSCDSLLDQVWKLMICSHCQELGQLADLASDWLFTLVQPIRSQLAC